MRKLILVLSGLIGLALLPATASAFSAGTVSGLKQAAPAGIVQVHSGPHACHFVRGRWWRDTRPYSTPGCWHRRHRQHHHHWRHHHRHHHWHRY